MMNKNRRIFFAAFLFSFLCFRFVSCTSVIEDLTEKSKNNSQEQTTTNPTPTPSQPEEKPIDISKLNICIVTYSTGFGIPPASFVVKAGTKLTQEMLPEITAIGKKFVGWFIDDTQVFGDDYTIESNICLRAKWMPGAPVYTVRHWKEAIEVGAPEFLYEEEVFEGKAGTTTQVEAKEYYGFIISETIEQKEIAKESTTIIDVHYERIEYTITLDLDGGTGTEELKGKFERPVPRIAKPVKDPYYFNGWTVKGGVLPKTFTKDESYTALWAENGIDLGLDVDPNVRITLTDAIEETALIITAETGFDSYSWKIDNRSPDGVTEVVASGSPNILTITDFTTREPGTYIIQVTAVKNGLEYTGRVIKTLE